MIKSILWDFDGVIAESVDVKGFAFREMYQKYGQEIANKVLAHHMDNGGVSRYEKFKVWHKEFLNIELSQDEIDKLADEFSELVVTNVVSSPMIPGVKEFLERNFHQIDSYIISATPEAELKKIVDEMKLTPLFKAVLGSPTSKVEHINKLVNENSIDIEKSVFIGDSINDFKAAEATNISFILREVDYNQETFKNFNGIRVPDFKNFESILTTI